MPSYRHVERNLPVVPHTVTSSIPLPGVMPMSDASLGCGSKGSNINIGVNPSECLATGLLLLRSVQLIKKALT